MTRSFHREPSTDRVAPGSIDHWQVLGLAPGADAASLKRAFRAQARRWHPDLNGNDPVAEERFKLVNEAYAVLSDPQRRLAWETGESPGQADDGPGIAADPFATGFPHFDDYLDLLLGRESPPHADEGAHGAVDPPAAAESSTEQGPFRQRPFAGAPFQTGAAGSTDAPADGWSGGDVATTPPSPAPVPAANDQETLVELTPEQALMGERIELALRDGTVVELWTPPLAGDGWRLRLAGVAAGGADHFLHLRVRTPEGLRIDGLRVLYPLELHPADAALGCQVVVPTLGGPVRLRVPARSSSGRLLRLRGRGQRLAERVGDQLVEVRIMIPEQLSEAEEALFRRLRQLDEERDQERLQGEESA